jgi:transglutaminase-like putative cysteine protease
MILIFSGIYTNAQDKVDYKFGKVNADEFKQKIYSVDSNANAVVLADIGSTEIVGNNHNWFSLVFKRYTRIHILNKNGYDAADVAIHLYTSGSAEEHLNNVKAVTYNLENGKVIETKLEKSNIFKDQLDKNWFVKKFTMPNVKEGCIIEYQYEIQSDFIDNLQSWAFQGGNPVLWSEYSVSIPQFFRYSFLSQGYQPFYLADSKNSTSSFTIVDSRSTRAAENTSFTAGVTTYRWVMKDVPALKEESYTYTLRNHLARIDFQLSEFLEPLEYKNVMGTWKDLAKRFLESSYFGDPISKKNNWLDDEVKPIVTGAKTEEEKAAKIYAYVRDHFTCTDHNRLDMDETLKNIDKAKRGNEAEINLLLIAMLRNADITTDPVILSTRAHGYAPPMYPIVNRYNYVIARAKLDNKYYYLDASVPQLGFGKLLPDCFNGFGHIINEDATLVPLSPDSILERKVSSIFAAIDENGNLKGTMQQKLGYYESMNIRNRIKEKGQDALIADMKKAYGSEAEIEKATFDSLDSPDNCMGMRYDFKVGQVKDDLIYLNPLFGEAYKENPFKSAKRLYPVEMPYTMDETYLLYFQVPEGYVVDEVPKQIMVKLNEEGDGMFEYRLGVENNAISLRSRIVLKRTFFKPAEYDMLREFFNLVVKKQSEQIVLKKKQS